MNRRDEYRVGITSDSALRAGLVVTRDWSAAGPLIDLCAGGVSMRVGPSLDAQALGVDHEVKLAFPSVLLNKPLIVAARLQYRVQSGDSLRCGFQFTDRSQFGPRLWPPLRALFNRRGAFRITPQNDWTAEIAADGARPEVALIDLSMRGFAVCVPIGVESALKGADRMRITLCLPGWTDRLSLQGIVRSRVLAPGGHIRYGGEFDLTEGESSDELRRVIGCALG